MARIDRCALTKQEIVREASEQFLEYGYTKTTISSICKALEMSPGNLTFHYPTKEHLLAELVDMLCKFQWEQIKKEANDGLSSVMAVCLELAAMASACEQDEVIKDFFISAYTGPMCLEIIRKNDVERAVEVFASYRPDWSPEQFAEAVILCSGIEYATLMTVGDPVPLEMRVTGALNNILSIFNIPDELKAEKIKRVFSMDYRKLGKQTIKAFRRYVKNANDQALLELLKR